MKFTLEIEIGTPTVRYRADVADILKRVSKNIRNMPDDVPEIRVIYDASSNPVGSWHWPVEQ